MTNAEETIPRARTSRSRRLLLSRSSPSRPRRRARAKRSVHRCLERQPDVLVVELRRPELGCRQHVDIAESDPRLRERGRLPGHADGQERGWNRHTKPCRHRRRFAAGGELHVHAAAPSVDETVQFTDTSTGTPTGWSWTFGDPGRARRIPLLSKTPPTSSVRRALQRLADGDRIGRLEHPDPDGHRLLLFDAIGQSSRRGPRHGSRGNGIPDGCLDREPESDADGGDALLLSGQRRRAEPDGSVARAAGDEISSRRGRQSVRRHQLVRRASARHDRRSSGAAAHDVADVRPGRRGHLRNGDLGSAARRLVDGAGDEADRADRVGLVAVRDRPAAQRSISLERGRRQRLRQPESFAIVLRGTDGTILGTSASVTLPPSGQWQVGIKDLFPSVTGDALTAEFQCVAGSAVPVGYGTLADNQSGDLTYFPSRFPPRSFCCRSSLE